MNDQETLTTLVRIAGAGQILMMGILMAIVPRTLGWGPVLSSMPRLHRQIHTVYSKYATGTSFVIGIFSLAYAGEIVSAEGLGFGVGLFAALYWGVRLSLQWIYDMRSVLTTPRMKFGFHLLTFLFASLTGLYLWIALRP